MLAWIFLKIFIKLHENLQNIEKHERFAVKLAIA